MPAPNTAISDLVIEAEADVEEALPHQKIRTIVRKMEPVGDNFVLLHVQTPRTQSLRFKAGQSVSITAENGSSAEPVSPAAHVTDAIFSFWWRARRGSLQRYPLRFNSQTDSGPGGSAGDSCCATTPVRRRYSWPKDGHSNQSLVEQAITIDNAEALHLIQIGGNPRGSVLDKSLPVLTDSLDTFGFYSAPAEDCSSGELAELLKQATKGLHRVDLYMAGPQEWLVSGNRRAG